MSEIGSVSNQIINSTQSTSQQKAATTNTENKNITAAEQGKLEEAIVGVISMQALTSLSESGSEAKETLKNPSKLAEETKEMEQKEQNEREDEGR